MAELDVVNLSVQVLSLLAPVITAGLGWLGVQLSKYVAAKTHSQNAGDVVLRINDIVTTVVTEVENTAVAAAKARSGSGGLTQADGNAIKAAAVAKIKSYLGAPGLTLLGKAFGLDGNTIDSFLGSKVESAVYAISNGANPTLPSTSTTLPPFLSGATPDNPYGGAVADLSMSPHNVPVPATQFPAPATVAAQGLAVPVSPGK